MKDRINKILDEWSPFNSYRPTDDVTSDILETISAEIMKVENPTRGS